MENKELFKGKLIGIGHSGKVYKGKLIDKIVAIKIISNEDHFILARNEIKKLKMLNHENIVEIYSNSKCQFEGIIIVMEYSNLGTLESFNIELRNNCFSEKNDYWKINNPLIKQISNGLNYIHENNIIHNDLKSQNVLIINSINGLIAKISDFGNSYSLDEYLEKNKGLLFWIRNEKSKKTKDFENLKNQDIYNFGVIVVGLSLRKHRKFDSYLIINENEKKLILNSFFENTPNWVEFLIMKCLDINISSNELLVDEIKSLIEQQWENNVNISL